MGKDDCLECLRGLRKRYDSTVLGAQELFSLEDVFDRLSYEFGSHIDTYVPEYFSEQLKQLDEPTKSLVQKIVILQCALTNWDVIFFGNYAESVVTQYQKTLQRILTMCQSDQGWVQEKDDFYFKDLAMAMRVMFPAGAQITEVSSGFGIKQGLRGGFVDSAKFLWLTLLQRGCKGYYQIHTHIPELSEFNPQGWNDCYLRIAEMLELNPQVKGIFGGSWFYDPQLKEISPRLMYLQDVPLENGASRFYTHDDTSGNAIYASKTRRQLYEEGAYTPRSYLLIWPRKAMIQWAKLYKRTHHIVKVPAGVVK